MLEILKARKKELGFTYEEIAKRADVPLDIIVDYFERKIPSLGYVSLRAINQVLFPGGETSKICEPEPAYKVHMMKKQGEYTVEDYLAWPEDQRIELIDGVIYDMASPIGIHQLIVLELGTLFRNYIRDRKGQCIPFVSPIDVQLDMDNKTIVQPDVLILCDRNKRKNGRIYGAPDFIVEVLSPSTRKKDMIKKLSKYQTAGVKEYWIVDTKEKKVIVYSNMTPEAKDITIYPAESKIPVGIYEGEYMVDFAEIWEYVEDWCEGEEE